MKRSGVWQWVWCWLGVLVAGCAARGGTGTSVPISSTVPLATLPRALPVIPTLTPIWRVIRPAMGGGGTNIANHDSTPPQTGGDSSPMPALMLDPLACYPAVPGGWWCLGALRNMGGMAYAEALVRITLLDQRHLPIALLSVPPAYPVIRPNQLIPYSALFRDAPESIGGATVELTNALAISDADAGSTGSVTLPVESVSNDAQGHVTATVMNPSAKAVMVSVIATLFDADDRVLGYRKIDQPEPLGAGWSRSVTVTVRPLTDSVAVTRADLIAEGTYTGK